MKMSLTQNKSILLAIALSFLCFGTVSAQTSSIQSPDSLHLYNALQNKYSVEQLMNHEVEIEDPAPLSPAQIETLVSLEEKARLQEEKVQIELKELNQKQEKALSEAENARIKITGNGLWRSTVLGNNLGIIEFHLVQIKGIQAALNSLTNKTADVPLKLEIQDQVEVLKDEQAKLEAVLSEQSDKFSFIGWLVATI